MNVKITIMSCVQTMNRLRLLEKKLRRFDRSYKGELIRVTRLDLNRKVHHDTDHEAYMKVLKMGIWCHELGNSNIKLEDLDRRFFTGFKYPEEVLESLMNESNSDAIDMHLRVIAIYCTVLERILGFKEKMYHVLATRSILDLSEWASSLDKDFIAEMVDMKKRALHWFCVFDADIHDRCGSFYRELPKKAAKYGKFIAVAMLAAHVCDLFSYSELVPHRYRIYPEMRYVLDLIYEIVGNRYRVNYHFCHGQLIEKAIPNMGTDQEEAYTLSYEMRHALCDAFTNCVKRYQKHIFKLKDKIEMASDIVPDDDVWSDKDSLRLDLNICIENLEFLEPLVSELLELSNEADRVYNLSWEADRLLRDQLLEDDRSNNNTTYI